MIHYRPLFSVLFFVTLLTGCSGSATNTPLPQPGTSVDTGSDIPSTLVFKEDFEVPKEEGLYAVLNKHAKLTVLDGVGNGQSRGIEATYVGYDRGSERIVREYRLGERGKEYTLCYDIRFDNDFQFVRGGKIMGLGPDTKVTGGNAVTPGGWSARSNFAEEGKVHTYVYSQNKDWKWGESVHSEGPVFRKGEYHRVTLQVALNDPPNLANGVSKIYVDGELHVAHENIQYRKVRGDSTLVSKLLFETFHGGNVPSYAPKDADGNYTTVKAYFDNIEVHRGMQVCK